MWWKEWCLQCPVSLGKILLTDPDIIKIYVHKWDMLYFSHTFLSFNSGRKIEREAQDWSYNKRLEVCSPYTDMTAIFQAPPKAIAICSHMSRSVLLLELRRCSKQSGLPTLHCVSRYSIWDACLHDKYNTLRFGASFAKKNLCFK